MGPKSKSPKSKSAPNALNITEDWQQELLDRIANLTEKLERIEGALLVVTQEKEELTTQVVNQAKEIAELRNSLNEREQYARNWSMRCLNIPIPSNKETDTRTVMQCVYDNLLLPILEGARLAGTILRVPDCEALLENAHILPGKAGTKPIICRFFSRYWRNLIFRNRREHAPREPGTQGRLRFPFFEDLTRATFMQLSTIKQQKDVVAAWTVNGSIRFRVKDVDTIYKTSSIHDTYADIVQ